MRGARARGSSRRARDGSRRASRGGAVGARRVFGGRETYLDVRVRVARVVQPRRPRERRQRNRLGLLAQDAPRIEARARPASRVSALGSEERGAQSRQASRVGATRIGIPRPIRTSNVDRFHRERVPEDRARRFQDGTRAEDRREILAPPRRAVARHRRGRGDARARLCRGRTTAGGARKRAALRPRRRRRRRPRRDTAPPGASPRAGRTTSTPTSRSIRTRSARCPRRGMSRRSTQISSTRGTASGRWGARGSKSGTASPRSASRGRSPSRARRPRARPPDPRASSRTARDPRRGCVAFASRVAVRLDSARARARGFRETRGFRGSRCLRGRRCASRVGFFSPRRSAPPPPASAGPRRAPGPSRRAGPARPGTRAPRYHPARAHARRPPVGDGRTRARDWRRRRRRRREAPVSRTTRRRPRRCRRRRRSRRRRRRRLVFGARRRAEATPRLGRLAKRPRSMSRRVPGRQAPARTSRGAAQSRPARRAQTPTPS